MVSSIPVTLMITFATGLYITNVMAIAMIKAHNLIANTTSPFLYPKNADNAMIAMIIRSTTIPIFFPPYRFIISILSR